MAQRRASESHQRVRLRKSPCHTHLGHLSSPFPEVDCIGNIIKCHLLRPGIVGSRSLRAQNTGFQARQVPEARRKHRSLHLLCDVGADDRSIERSVEEDFLASLGFDADKPNLASRGICNFSGWQHQGAAAGDGLHVERSHVAACVRARDLWPDCWIGPGVWRDDQVRLRRGLDRQGCEKRRSDREIGVRQPRRSVSDWHMACVGRTLPVVRRGRFHDVEKVELVIRYIVELVINNISACLGLSRRSSPTFAVTVVLDAAAALRFAIVKQKPTTESKRCIIALRFGF
jgi:hypothetical protein